MHYYQFNIGDYRKDTIHLSRLEHSIYRDLIDWYYLEETPIPTETQSVMRRLRLDTEVEKTALQNVLSDFFKPSLDGYRQARIDQEIADYHAQCDKNKANGKKGGRPKGKKTQSVSSGLPVASQTDATANPNQEPLTTNQEPIEKTAPAKRTAPPAIAKPDDVDQQTWEDWLQLRKTKKAPVTQTVVNGARVEASKAGLSLEDFLRVWCRRGSQGLEAAWLKPDERPQQSQQKTFAERDREAGWARWEQMTNQTHPDRIAAQSRSVIDITPRSLEISQ